MTDPNADGIYQMTDLSAAALASSRAHLPCVVVSADVARRHGPVVLIVALIGLMGRLGRSAAWCARAGAAEQRLEERHRTRHGRTPLARGGDFLRPLLRRVDHRALALDRRHRAAVEAV